MRKNTGIKMKRGECDTDLNRKIIVPYVGTQFIHGVGPSMWNNCILSSHV